MKPDRTSVPAVADRRANDADRTTQGDEKQREVSAFAAAPTTSEDALRLAIKLAVEAGEYERAALLLDAARRTAQKPATVTPIAVVRESERRG